MDTLRVHMFGEFQIILNDRALEFPGGIYSKTMRLLILLLYYGRNGVPRQKVLDELYGDSEPGNDAGNLRAVSFRLRKQMAAFGLLEENEQLNEKGIFRWNPSGIDVWVDALRFGETAEKALRDSDMQLLSQALSLYTGEFLPDLSAELWVAARQASYQELYFDCARRYLEYLSGTGAYEEMLAVAREVGRMYPYEEWFIAELDALIGLGRWKEALEISEQSTRILMDKFGIRPSDEMAERTRNISLHMKGSSKGLLEIRSDLEEKKYEQGAYYCDYASFVGAYRYEMRRMERTGQSLYLVLCTITDRNGSLNIDDNDSRFEEMVGQLSHSIRVSLRRTDVYTRYGKNQFLIILIGLKQEDCPIAYARIDRSFARTQGAGHYRVNYFMVPVTAAPSIEEKPLRFGGRMWQGSAV